MWELEALVLGRDLLVGLVRLASRHPRHLAAILCAVAIPVLVALPYMGRTWRAEYSAATLFLSIALGVAVGVRSTHLGAGPDRGRRIADWSVVIVGSAVCGLLVLSFIVFLPIFGNLDGYCIVAAASAAYLVAHLAFVARRLLGPRRHAPT
jgi:hypothetical protein